MPYSFEWSGLPDPRDPPCLELQRLAQERNVNLHAEFFPLPSKRLILGTEDIPLTEAGRLRGLAMVLKCEPRYLVDLTLAYLRATGKPVPKLSDIAVPPPIGRPRKMKPTNPQWAAPPRQPGHYRPRTPKFSDAEILAVAHLTVPEACAELGCGATVFRERLRKLGFQPRPKGRKRREKSDASLPPRVYITAA
jgi:hypothetical protein